VVHDVDGRSRLEFPIGKPLYQSSGWISNIRFSPDGTQIAFMNHPALWDNRGILCVVNLNGQVTTLSKEWESAQGLAWHDKEIWFTAIEKGNNLNLMAATLSGSIRTVLDLPVGINLQDISADGRVLVTLNAQRMAMAFGTVGGSQDIDLSWHDWNIAKAISEGGEFVLFEDASEAAGPAYMVALRRLDGALPMRLGEGSAGGLSPDDKWAISISDHPQQVTLLPIGAGQPRPVEIAGLEHVGSGWARFLPNGEQLIVNANEPAHGSRCYLLSLSGTKPRPVTPEGVRCGPASPDNRFLVGIGSNSAVAIYPLAGGTPQPIPGLQAGFQPVQWSRDGSALYGYHLGELPSRIYKVVLATGKQTTVQELRPGVPAGVVMVSPVVVNTDGTRYAYSYSQTLSVLYIISGLR
jgi:hypothetical protein